MLCALAGLALIAAFVVLHFVVTGGHIRRSSRARQRRGVDFAY
jgi:hypothetical protein